MKTIRVFTDNDLAAITNKIGYALEGNDGFLDKLGMPKFSHNYDTIDKQQRLTDALKKEDSKVLATHLKNSIISKNSEIVKYLEAIKKLQSKIVEHADILNNINEKDALIKTLEKILKIMNYIGIDPGLQGGIAILDQSFHVHKMKEDFIELFELLRPYANNSVCAIEQISLRPDFNPFANSRMDVLKENYVTLQNVLKANNIPYTLVAAQSWQKFHNLKLPSGKAEVGMDIEDLRTLKTELKHLETHLRIEKKVPNDTIKVGNVLHILNSSENRLKARKMLCDDFTYFSKNDLNKAKKEVEDGIEKFKRKEKQLRKNRYKAKAKQIMDASGIDLKVTLWNADAILLLAYAKKNL